MQSLFQVTMCPTTSSTQKVEQIWRNNNMTWWGAVDQSCTPYSNHLIGLLKESKEIIIIMIVITFVNMFESRDAGPLAPRTVHGTGKKPNTYLLHSMLKHKYSSAGTVHWHPWAILANHLEKPLVNLWKDQEMVPDVEIYYNLQLDVQKEEMTFYYSILQSHSSQLVTHSDIQISDHIFPALRKIKVEQLNYLLARQSLFCIAT